MDKKSFLRKSLNILSSSVIFFEIIIIAFVVITKISGGVPSLFGHQMFVIVSPSMSPEINVGDVIISEKYENENLEVGDVVQYVGKSGDINGKIITHEIISISGEGSDEIIITKGVANDEADPPITRADIVSVMRYKTIIIGPLYGVFSSTAGFIFLVMIPLSGMIIYEIINLLKEIRKDNEKEGAGQDEQ